MAPEIERIKALGVTALVECSTTGVGRRADLDLAVSQATGFPIVVPTGSYREP
jgi:phosphotriesterase-related protein